MKKIMILGGNIFQTTAIKRAKELGYYVISVDYLPDNPGHKFSDEYHNVSTVDKEAILKLAEKLKIDGILAFASDVSAPTAAYVAEKLELPTNLYESVMILTHKNLFRQFMREHHYLMPEGKSFTHREEARAYCNDLPLPVMVKPVDSSGSKGVTKLTDRADFDTAFDEALSYSISKQIIVERFIQKNSYQIDGDGFVKDGRIAFFGVMDQHNNVIRNPHAPIGLSYPSVQSAELKDKAQKLIQDIFDRLGMRFGAFNFEYIIDKNGDIYLLEIGPRNGGNFIPDTIKCASGVDMVTASIKACVGDGYDEALIKRRDGIATSYVVHSMESGRFERLEISPEIRGHIVEERLSVKPGDRVNAFRNGGDSLGAMILRFDDVAEMNQLMDEMWEHIGVILK